jgi:hypothetical protein
MKEPGRQHQEERLMGDDAPIIMVRRKDKTCGGYLLTEVLVHT